MNGDGGRDGLQRRWLHLTRHVLPGMADAAGWPIRYDHCFMRVCLDHAVGAAWHSVVPRPAVRHMTDEQLQAAIGWAERIAAEPGLLPGLNQQSLQWRGKA